jgi:hypothetical protein
MIGYDFWGKFEEKYPVKLGGIKGRKYLYRYAIKARGCFQESTGVLSWQ